MSIKEEDLKEQKIDLLVKQLEEASLSDLDVDIMSLPTEDQDNAISDALSKMEEYIKRLQAFADEVTKKTDENL